MNLHWTFRSGCELEKETADGLCLFGIWEEKGDVRVRNFGLGMEPDLFEE